MKTTTLPLGHLISRSPIGLPFLLIQLFVALAWFGLAPAVQATCMDGCSSIGNTFLGESALDSDTTGGSNTAIGFDALTANTAGGGNTANGASALAFNTTGNDNTATGVNALFFNTTGGDNTANGFDALFSNTTGYYNTASGFGALLDNTTGSFNTANGFDALFSNITGNNNTATGFQAMNGDPANGSSGTNNTATGYEALFSYTTGGNNTATGYQALSSNTIGNNNTAIGLNALYGNSTGSSNIALGFQAGMNVNGNNNIDIGNTGITGESGKIRIGTKPAQKATFIAGISGVTIANGVGVIINPQGQLGTVVSSARFKDAVKPMDETSEAILALKPVTFRYRKELDPDSIPQFGLMAEEVEKVNPDLVARDDHGQPYTVRYEAVNAMLLNEFLKEHRKVEELEKQVKKLTAGLQKVSAQIELNKSAPQTVCLPAGVLREGGNSQ